MIGSIVLLAALAFAAYVVNDKVVRIERFPQLLINVFLGTVALMVILQLFGVGL